MSESYNKAIKYLAIREYCKKELSDKLISKGYEKEEVSQTIDKLIEANYLSDKRFASSYIRSRLRKTAEGKALLELRLEIKRCNKEDIKASIDEAWAEGIYKQSLKKSLSDSLKKYDKIKVIDKFYKKGFTLREINEGIKEIEDNE